MKVADGKLQCKRCKRKFKGGVSGIKEHVDRIRGQGIAVCSIDPTPGGVCHNAGVDNSVAAGSSNAHGAVINAMNSSQGTNSLFIEIIFSCFLFMIMS